MKRFAVNQDVLCTVKVWYNIEANSLEEALTMVSKNTCPTSLTATIGADYEVHSDDRIIKTIIEEEL